jgi:flagellar basal body rod protein FlgG
MKGFKVDGEGYLMTKDGYYLRDDDDDSDKKTLSKKEKK